MNIHDIELPPLVGTLAGLPDRHREVIEAYGRACARAAIAPYQQRIAELESQLEAIGAGGVDGRRLIGDSCHQRRGEPESCFKFGHSKHGGECVNVAPQPAESHVDRANRIVDSWPEWKKNYALTKHDVKATQSAEPVDISAFDELIDLYQDAQRDGTFKERTKARAALKEAYRKALAQPDEQENKS